ncbi:MAG: alpha-glucan family phosphorylase, partial [Pyrinomonadaceae bacterium]
IQELGLRRDELIALGRANVNDQNELFGVTPLALKLCGKINAVSRKHGEVSRQLWKILWPEKSIDEIPINYITNGVHAPSWTSSLIRSLYAKHIGENWSQLIRDPTTWAAGVARIPDEDLWQAHSLLRKRLIAFTRLRSYLSRAEIEMSVEEIQAALHMFDENALTIGFARRVAAYKRWGLLFTDVERLLRLIDNEERPVQFIFAGKAHPQDLGAKQILQQFTLWRKDPRIRRHCVFIQDYDQEIARQMVQGVDVWMNLPRRPLEASGTSGQKVAMNGGLNLSILDGWWPEGYDGNNGWAIGGEEVGTDSAVEDAQDAGSLYKVLEESIVPLFYDRDDNGIPRRWVARMKHSLATLPPAFSSDRMVSEYARKVYV